MAYELVIEADGYGTQKIIIETKSRDVFEQVKDNPAIQGKTGESLVEAFLKVLPPDSVLSLSRKNRNDEYNDGPEGQPAYQKFNPAKGILRARWEDGELKDCNQLSVVEIKHYKDGKLNDTRKGVAAVQGFSEKTGKLTVKKHYKEGLLNDAPDGEAAVHGFDDNGDLNLKAFYREDKRNDGPKGEPAAWEKKSNGDIYIWHYTDDRRNDLPDGMPCHQQFTADGVLFRVGYFRDEKYADTPDGIPGALIFNRKSGELTEAWRVKNDKAAEQIGRLAKLRLAKKPEVRALKNLHL